MSLSALILMIAAAQSPASVSGDNPATRALAQIFVDACVYGEARLTSDVARRMEEKEVSIWRRVEEGRSQYFSLAHKDDAMLRVTEFDAPRSEDGVVRICTVLTSGHDLPTAWRIVARSVSGDANPKVAKNVDEYQIDHPVRGYRLRMSRYWMSTFVFDPTTAAKLVAEQPKSVRGKPVVSAIDTIF